MKNIIVVFIMRKHSTHAQFQGNRKIIEKLYAKYVDTYEHLHLLVHSQLSYKCFIINLMCPVIIIL